MSTLKSFCSPPPFILQMLGPPPLPPSTVDSSRRSSVATEEVEEPMGSAEAGYEGESHAPLPKEEESEEIKQVKAKQSGKFLLLLF